MAVFGVIVCGMSVGFFKTSLFGADPFQCFVSGIESIVPIGFGTLYTVINVVLLIGVFLLDKHYIGIATCVNIFLLGYIVEFSEYILNTTFGEIGLVTRIIFLCIGIVALCFSSAFYFTADLGVSTYDAVSLILADKKVAKFRFCRIGTDLICVIVGFALGATIGIGTLITAFFMGPLIEFFRVKISEPFLLKFKE